MLPSVGHNNKLWLEPSFEIRKLEHLVISKGAGQMQSLALSQLLNPCGEGLMQRLLIVGCLCDPEHIVVLFSIDVPNMAGNDVVFVAGRTFEREFTFDCHPAATRIKSD
jgi:hypothetical protein